MCAINLQTMPMRDVGSCLQGEPPWPMIPVELEADAFADCLQN